jgi:hypothetical protein
VLAIAGGVFRSLALAHFRTGSENHLASSPHLRVMGTTSTETLSYPLRVFTLRSSRVPGHVTFPRK